MRILLALHTWPPEGKGGTEAHAQSVAAALSERGHQIGVFARTGRPERPEFEVTTSWEGKTSVSRINNTYAQEETFEATYKNQRIHEAFEREMDEFKPDLVHIHHLTGLSTTIIEAVKARGLPLVITLHDFWMQCPRGQRMTNGLSLCETIDRTNCLSCLSKLWPNYFKDRENEPTIVDLRGQLSPASLAEFDRHMTYALNLCDVVVAPSAFHAERIQDFPIDPDRVVALPHGLSPIAGLKPRDTGKKPTRIGYLGSVIPVKGVHVLIEAFMKLGRRDLSLHIHGEVMRHHEDLTYGARLQAQARRAPNIHFHGGYVVQDLQKLLSELDILVVPSIWWETYCLTIREGLMAGIPVVASDLGALREALDGERDGLLFRPGDADHLKQRLTELIDQPEVYARYCNRGAAVKPMARYVTELEALYERATADAARRADDLVVAPPSFPRKPARPAPQPVDVSWDSLAVSTRHRGSPAIAVRTSMPTKERPRLELKFAIDEGTPRSGVVSVDVDFDSFLKTVESANAAIGKAPQSPTTQKNDREPLLEPPKSAALHAVSGVKTTADQKAPMPASKVEDQRAVRPSARRRTMDDVIAMKALLSTRKRGLHRLEIDCGSVQTTRHAQGALPKIAVWKPDSDSSRKAGTRAPQESGE